MLRLITIDVSTVDVKFCQELGNAYSVLLTWKSLNLFASKHRVNYGLDLRKKGKFVSELYV